MALPTDSRSPARPLARTSPPDMRGRARTTPLAPHPTPLQARDTASRHRETSLGLASGGVEGLGSESRRAWLKVPSAGGGGRFQVQEVVVGR
eukprot:2078091-Rhodomonas_salina.1